MLIPISGFAPDIDPTSPGVLVDVVDYIPTMKGYGAAPSNASAGFDALAAACIGASLVQLLDGTTRLFAATAAAIYEAVTSPTWTDRSKVGGYSGTTDHRWSFAQFGNTTYAALKSDTVQSSTSGAFADVAGANKARFVETVPGFVMLADTNDATYGDQSDRWKCSAYLDGTDWTVSVTTQANTGRLVGAPGPIRGWKRLGDDIVAYKDRALFVGRYVGSPDVFDFTLLPGDVGCASNEAIINIGSAHLFIGYEDIYYFDGSRPVPIGEQIKSWFFSDLNKQFRYKITGVHDRTNSLAMFFYPSNSSTSGTTDSCIVFNYKTNKWGFIDRGAECALENLTGQVTYANIGNYFASYAAISVSYDSPFWTQNYPVPAIFDTSHILQSITGVPGTCSITTGDLGEDQTMTLITRTVPRFSTAPASATLTNYYRNTAGSSLTTDATTTMSSGKCDFLREARWHRLKLTTVGVCELSGLDIQAVSGGEE